MEWLIVGVAECTFKICPEERESMNELYFLMKNSLTLLGNTQREGVKNTFFSVYAGEYSASLIVFFKKLF